MCREHVVDVREQYPRIEQAGGQVVAVTMGSPQQAADFRARLRLPFECLADKERAAYARYQLAEGGIRQVAGPQVWLPGLKALIRGGAGVPVGDVRQLQGVFLVDRQGIVRLAHRGQTSVDLPPLEELLTAVAAVEGPQP